MLPYLSMNEGCFVLFCHNHNVLSYVMELIIKKFSMNRGAMTWFRMFRATV
jgi:hypothetical protein